MRVTAAFLNGSGSPPPLPGLSATAGAAGLSEEHAKTSGIRLARAAWAVGANLGTIATQWGTRGNSVRKVTGIRVPLFSNRASSWSCSLGTLRAPVGRDYGLCAATLASRLAMRSNSSAKATKTTIERNGASNATI